jgi:hypothetical protein
LEDNLGKKSRPSFKKRRKELARQQKQQDKVANRRAKTEAKASRKPGDEDPDLIGIQPGPQALPEEWQDLPEGDSSPDSTEDET